MCDSIIYDKSPSLEDEFYELDPNEEVSSEHIDYFEYFRKNKIYQTDWTEYWEENGDKIVNTSWIKLQSYYISLCSEIFRNITLSSNSKRESSKKIASLSRKWIRLWEEHYKDQYNKCFNDWFKQNYILPRKKLDEGSKTDSTEYIEIDHSKELKDLGLPLNFGNKKTFYLVKDEEEEIMGKNEVLKSSKAIKKKKNKKIKIPPLIENDRTLMKYWQKRFRLFSKFDDGIQLDREGWFSVTPEEIASRLSKKTQHFDIIIDAFCGCGGNTIQFAKRCKKVIAIDLDPDKINMAKNNAKIYGVDHKIEFIVGDFLILSESLCADGVFLSPPWGGPNYKQKEVYDIEADLLPVSASNLVEKARNITNNIIIYLPKNSDINQIKRLAGAGNKVLIEKSYFQQKLVALTAFYGETIQTS